MFLAAFRRFIGISGRFAIGFWCTTLGWLYDTTRFERMFAFTLDGVVTRWRAASDF